MVGVNGLLVRRGVIVHQFCINPDFLKRLPQIRTELAGLIEVGRGQKLQRKTCSIRTSRITRLIQKSAGLGDVEIIGLNVIRVKFRRILRYGAGRCSGVTEKNLVDDEFPVNGVRDRLSDLEIRQFLAAMVDFHHQLIGQCLIAIRNNLYAGLLGDAGEIGERHG